MVAIVLAHTALARVRLAHAPVGALVASLRVLRDPRRRHRYGAWLASVHGQLAGCGWTC
jgi:hypothetical protein